jgi:hypothetical protein
VAGLVRSLCGGNQQFAGHATNAGASGAVGATFDQQNGMSLGMGGPVGAHAGSTGTDVLAIDQFTFEHRMVFSPVRDAVLNACIYASLPDGSVRE